MTHSSNSTEWYNDGCISGRDRDGFAHGNDAHKRYWTEKKADDFESGTFSMTGLRTCTYAPEIGGNKSLSSFSLNIEPNNGLHIDNPQWTASHSPLQNFDSQGSDAKSSFGSEYSFALQELVENLDPAFGVDLTQDLQFSDIEEDPAVRGAFNLNHATALSGGYHPINSGPGNIPVQLRLASSSNDPDGFENRIDARVSHKSDRWPSTSTFSLPLRPNPYRSMRRSNAPANRAQTQPKSHPCDRCSSAFGRAGDLRRHYRVHFPDRRTFHCRLEGCPRNGQKGFYRRDKFRDHQRQAHGFGSESELVLAEGV